MSSNSWIASAMSDVSDLSELEDIDENGEELEFKHLSLVMSPGVFAVVFGFAILGISATISRGISLLRRR